MNLIYICLCLSIVLNIAFIVILHIEHEKSCDRLLSRDLTDYKTAVGELKKEPQLSSHERAIKEWRSKGEKNGEK